MSEPEKKKSGWVKAAVVGLLGVGGGAAGTYATAVVNQVVKPTLPVANFSLASEGLNVTCQNHATGESGWWDFGDGTPLEPFAPEKPATHAYTKPGSYTVKLTVRNYFADENERSVPVEVGAAAKVAPSPQITGFTVTPVGSASIAPATFRITADVANAEGCVWDFGDGRVEAGDAGKIDRMVTFDKPGSFPVQLFAHGGKLATRQWATAKVEAPKANDLVAILKVTDSGNRVTRMVRTESVAIPVPTQKNAAANFSKTIQTRPGCTIAEATANANLAGVKNLKVAVAADKRSVTVAGEWIGDQKATAKAAGGSDVIVPVKLTEQRTIAVQPTVTMVTGKIPSSMVLSNPAVVSVQLPLPPAVPGLTREFQLEIRHTNQFGSTAALMRAPDDGKGAMTLPWARTMGNVNYNASLKGDTVVIEQWVNVFPNGQ